MRVLYFARGKMDRRLRNSLAFEESVERFRQVVESAPNAIVMIGPTGHRDGQRADRVGIRLYA